MLAERIAAGLALALLVFGAIELARVSHSSHQSQHRENKQPSPAKAHEAPSSPTVSDAAKKKQQSEGKQKGSWQDKFFDHMPDWFVALFTGVLALVTWRLVTMTGRLWESTEKLWDAGERQVRIAEQSAEAAKVSAEVAKQAMIASQRAWIRRTRIFFSTPLEVRDDGLVNSAVAFEFTNVGNAPALHINEFAWLLPVTDGLVPQERATELFAGVREHPVSGGFTLFPGQSYPRDRDIPVHHSVHLTNEQAEAASDDAGRMSLFVAACINYVFSSDLNHHHQTSCLFEVRTPGFITHVGGTAIAETNLRLDESGFLGMDVAD